MLDSKIEALSRQADKALQQATSEKRTYTVSEIQEILGISQPTAYRLIKKNLFRSVKIGRTVRISKISFDTWLDAQNR